jgi:RNA polymerase sigma factor (sigma-70 family)
MDDIIDLLKHDDPRALRLLLERSGRRIDSLIRGRFGNLLDADERQDLLQDALLKLWNRRDRFDENRGSIEGWFYLLARNQAIDYLRRRQRDDESADRRYRIQPEPRSSQDREALHRAILDLGEELNERQRRLLETEFVIETQSLKVRSSPDLAAEFGLTPAALRQLRFRVKRKLEQFLRLHGFRLIPVSFTENDHD